MSTKGIKQSPEHIRARVKARQRNGTYKHSAETRARISAIQIGRKVSAETKHRHSVAMKAAYENDPSLRKKRSEQQLKSHTFSSKGKRWNWNDESKARGRIAQAGKNNPMFGRRGILCPAFRNADVDEKTKARQTLEYRQWRRAVFERDDFRCLDCGAKSGETGRHVELEADHIYPFAYFPRLRYQLENGRTLCAECHRKTSTFAGRAKTLTFIN
jgi:5-methylcytosine-specific restriction endonuclease McrA